MAVADRLPVGFAWILHRLDAGLPANSNVVRSVSLAGAPAGDDQ